MNQETAVTTKEEEGIDADKDLWRRPIAKMRWPIFIKI